MTQYITLLGSEDVSRAGHSMQDAARSMGGAAANLSDALERHQRFLDDWLTRLDATLQDRTHDLGITLGPLA